jgi:octaprenyl-diphosphate synthase
MAFPPPRNGQAVDRSLPATPGAPAERLHDTIGDAFARIAPDLERVEAALRDTLQSRAALIPVLGEHLLSSGGKRLRPALVLLAAELCGYV